METQILNFPQCPYPEYIRDEDSDCTIKNDKYILWMEGFITGIKAGLQTMSIVTKGNTPEALAAIEQIDKLMRK